MINRLAAAVRDSKARDKVGVTDPVHAGDGGIISGIRGAKQDDGRQGVALAQ